MKRVRTTARIATVLLGALLLASGACDFPQGANGNGQGGNGPGNGQTGGSGWRGEYTVGDDASTTTVEIWTCDALNKAGALDWSLTFHSEMHDDGDGYSTTGTITGSDSFTFPTRPPQGVRWLSDPTDFIFEGVVDYGIDGQDPFSAELVYYYTEWVYELVVVEDDGEVTAVSIESVDGYFNFCLFLVGAPAPFYCSGAQHVSSWNGGPSPLVPELHPDCPL